MAAASLLNLMIVFAVRSLYTGEILRSFFASSRFKPICAWGVIIVWPLLCVLFTILSYCICHEICDASQITNCSAWSRLGYSQSRSLKSLSTYHPPTQTFKALPSNCSLFSPHWNTLVILYLWMQKGGGWGQIVDCRFGLYFYCRL